MMDLAMHILDLVYNSIRAHAQHIKITILDSKEKDLIEMKIDDDGDGMSEAMLTQVQNPFVTSRTTRKVGLGVAFISQLAKDCEGAFKITSKLGEGTHLLLSLKRSHIDVPPWGDLGETLATIIQGDSTYDVSFTYQKDEGEFILDTKVIKELVSPVAINDAAVVIWLKDYVNEGLAALRRTK
ncbi:MAG: ATP-binding protein [Erysipelotrichaceae bacterium]